MHSKPLFALLTAAALLSACRSPTAPAAPTETPVTDACAVLTPSEISAVIGVPIDPGKHTIASSTIMCSWFMTGGTGEAAVKLVLNFTSLASFEKEKNAKSPNITLTPTSGIGDEAFYVTTEFGTSLYVRKGSTAIAFSIHDKTLPTDRLMAKEKVLGLKAATRI
jgi:hypothetical protein